MNCPTCTRRQTFAVVFWAFGMLLYIAAGVLISHRDRGANVHREMMEGRAR